eukprot:1810163-Ditylum_brightwellii.AAC.1
MLANYTKGYDDFYSKYKGQRCKRDYAYKDAEYFCDGMNPWPSSLSIIKNQNTSNVTTDAVVEEKQLVIIEESSGTTDGSNGQCGKSKYLGDSECVLSAAK